MSLPLGAIMTWGAPPPKHQGSRTYRVESPVLASPLEVKPGRNARKTVIGLAQQLARANPSTVFVHEVYLGYVQPGGCSVAWQDKPIYTCWSEDGEDVTGKHRAPKAKAPKKQKALGRKLP